MDFFFLFRTPRRQFWNDSRRNKYGELGWPHRKRDFFLSFLIFLKSPAAFDTSWRDYNRVGRKGVILLDRKSVVFLLYTGNRQTDFANRKRPEPFRYTPKRRFSQRDPSTGTLRLENRTNLFDLYRAGWIYVHRIGHNYRPIKFTVFSLLEIENCSRVFNCFFFWKRQCSSARHIPVAGITNHRVVYLLLFFTALLIITLEYRRLSRSRPLVSPIKPLFSFSLFVAVWTRTDYIYF